MNDLDESHLAHLRARIRAGEDGATDDLVRAITPLVSTRCRRLLPCPADAEEATQDALMSVASKLDQFVEGRVFAAWVSVIASNSARSTYRRLKRHARETPHERMVEHGDPRTTSVIAGTRLDLLDALEALEEQNPEQAQAVVLRDLVGMSYDDVAQHTAEPLGTIKARIHRGRQFVRDRLVERLT